MKIQICNSNSNSHCLIRDKLANDENTKLDSVSMQTFNCSLGFLSAECRGLCAYFYTSRTNIYKKTFYSI